MSKTWKVPNLTPRKSGGGVWVAQHRAASVAKLSASRKTAVDAFTSRTAKPSARIPWRGDLKKAA